VLKFKQITVRLFRILNFCFNLDFLPKHISLHVPNSSTIDDLFCYQ